jgi:hypothetical protein
VTSRDAATEMYLYKLAVSLDKGRKGCTISLTASVRTSGVESIENECIQVYLLNVKHGLVWLLYDMWSCVETCYKPFRSLSGVLGTGLAQIRLLCFGTVNIQV